MFISLEICIYCKFISNLCDWFIVAVVMHFDSICVNPVPYDSSAASFACDITWPLIHKAKRKFTHTTKNNRLSTVLILIQSIRHENIVSNAIKQFLHLPHHSAQALQSIFHKTHLTKLLYIFFYIPATF